MLKRGANDFAAANAFRRGFKRNSSAASLYSNNLPIRGLLWRVDLHQ